MFCDAYHKSLTEAAAGRELTPVLRQHLSSCESCRTAFAEEQSLFAAIDSGLQAAANPEAPATLIPRVHVLLNNQPARENRKFGFLIWTFSGAAVTAAILLGLLFSPSGHEPLIVAPDTRPKVVSVENSPLPTAVNSMGPGGVSHLQHGKKVALVASRGSDSEHPEVFVPPDEGIALLRYEQFLRKRSSAAVLLARGTSLDMPQGIEPLQIAEIEIPTLSKSYGEGDLK